MNTPKKKKKNPDWKKRERRGEEEEEEKRREKGVPIEEQGRASTKNVSRSGWVVCAVLCRGGRTRVG